MTFIELKDFMKEAKTIKVYCILDGSNGEFFVTPKEDFIKSIDEFSWWLEDSDDIDATFDGGSKTLFVG